MLFTPAVRNLLFINIGFWAIPELLGQLNFLNELLGMHSFFSPLFNISQVFTYMFLHGGFTHMLFNMLGLVLFGSNLERVWGTQRFLIFYLVCGVGAGILYGLANWWELHGLIESRDLFLASPNPDDFASFIQEYDSKLIYQENGLSRFIDEYSNDPDNPLFRQEATSIVRKFSEAVINGPMVGASGAVYGILMAFGMLFPDALVYLYFFPVKARYAVVIFGIMSLFGAFHPTPGDNVAHYAHLGGMLFGFLLVKYYPRQRL